MWAAWTAATRANQRAACWGRCWVVRSAVHWAFLWADRTAASKEPLWVASTAARWECVSAEDWAVLWELCWAVRKVVPMADWMVELKARHLVVRRADRKAL